MKATRFDPGEAERAGFPCICNECKGPIRAGEHVVRGKMYGSHWVKHLRCFDSHGEQS